MKIIRCLICTKEDKLGTKDGWTGELTGGGKVELTVWVCGEHQEKIARNLLTAYAEAYITDYESKGAK